MADQWQWVHTDAGRTLVTRSLVGGLGLAETLTHLAVGDGAVTVTSGILQKPSRSASIVGELGRVRYTERKFVVADAAGAILADRRYAASPTPTNLIYFLFRFLDAEAQGQWRQLALFGGGVSYLQRGATLLDSGGLAGDDRANAQVVLSGGYTPAESQNITVTCTTGGGSGVAKIGWVSTGDVAPGSNIPVTFGTPVPITGSGLALAFSGGADTVLTQGAQWDIRGTRSSQTALYAAGGVYDPGSNRAGQVLAGGTCFQLGHRTPAYEKTATAIDVVHICEVLNNA